MASGRIVRSGFSRFLGFLGFLVSGLELVLITCCRILSMRIREVNSTGIDDLY